jgi:hypothetical protein
MKNVMPNVKRELSEPAVRKLLSGLKHTGKRYYRVNPTTGVHVPVAARSELMKLDMSNATASRLIRLAVSAGLITEENIDLAQESHRSEKEAATDDDIEDEDEEMEFTSRHSKSPLGLSDIPRGELDRYELVKTGSGFWGYYDREHDREVILSRDKEEVLEEIYALRRNANKSPFAWPTGQSIS